MMRPKLLCLCALLGLVVAGARPATADGPTDGGATGAAPSGVAASGADETAETTAGTGAVGAGPVTVHFNFKDASFEQVIDFFSRTTGLPVVWQTEPPAGTLSYLSPETYELPEALRVLNVILQSKGVMLRPNHEMLYLQKLSDMQKADVPTFVGRLPEEVTSDQIVTVVCPLNIAVAGAMAEKLAAMVASYGSVAAMDQQNALIITETAAQVRRLLKIVDELDRSDPEDAVEIIPILHTDAKTLMEPLKALLSRTVEKIVLDKNKKPKTVREQEMTGLNISFDERTNSIIAKGVQSRIDKLQETIALLDVPGADAGRVIRTFTLGRLSPQEAAKRLETLFGKLPEEERPTLLPLDDVGKLTIVGDVTSVAEASDVLQEIDGETAYATGDDERIIAVVAIENAEPAPIIDAITRLLTTRQQSALKLVAGPNAGSIVVAGPVADVAAVRAIVPVLDALPRPDRQVRVVRITAPDAAGAIARATKLHRMQAEASGAPDGGAPDLSVEFDEAGRTLTLIGAVTELDRFAAALRTVETNAVVDRETRQIDVTNAAPSAIAASIAALARPLLTPRDGSAYLAPEIEAVDPLDLLIVTARPDQFAVLESLIDTLDRPDPGDRQYRVITLAGIEHVDRLLERTDDAYARLVEALGDERPPDPETELDTLTGNLIVTGTTDAVRQYEQALGEARRLLPPARSGRMYAIQQAKASDVLESLHELWRKTAPVDDVRAVPDPRIEVIERTNSLYVVAEPTQHAVIERYVRDLDTLEETDLPPMRLIQVRAADSGQLASMLERRYDGRQAQERRERPVVIDADTATNTLIVTAHDDVYEEIRAFVEDVNRSEEGQADRQTLILPLKRARATDLATALEKLYPEPPMPLDRRGNPLPHLRQPREVYVSADAATNTLIIEAPAERRASFEALVEQLDRVELPPRAELRTYTIERGDPAIIARTLTELARRGVMSEQPPDGSKPVEVLVQAEATSRTLIVAGDAVTFAKTEEILDDLQAVPVERALRIFDVSGADAKEIADRASALYAEQTAEIPDAQPVSVDVDRDRGTILAIAEDEAMFRFAAILNQLQATIGPPPDIRLVPLEHADAAEVVAFLRDLAQSHLSMVGSQAGPAPMFEAIERTNSVLVAAGREQHDIIHALIDGLDRVEPREMPPLRILQLRTADAQNLAGALQRQYDQRPFEERNEKPVTISADALTNALIVACHRDLLPEIVSIVDELNTANRIDDEGREIRIFPLKVARAEELARTLDDMFPQPPVPVDRRGRPMPDLREPREVVVRADPQTNSIIVDAPIQRMTGFEQLVEQLDRARIAEETEIRTYPVQHAAIDSLAASLRELAQAGTLSPSGHDRRVPITVGVEAASGVLVVSGPAEIFPRVELLIEELDVKRTGPTTALRFFRLSHARADTLAPMLRQILMTRMAEEVSGAGSNVEALLTVTADRKTNTLIISAPEAILPVAAELVEQLDDSTATVGEPTIRIRPLTFADAGAVATALGPALAGVISEATGEPVDVKLIPATGSNAIILVGLNADLEAVESLIEPLDARPAMDAMDARTFRLAHADAVKIAKVVENLLTDQQASDPRIVIERLRRSRGQVDLTPKIRVEADQRTNSLIVSGPQRTVALAEALIGELDAADEDAQRVYDTFTPARADASALAASVQRVVDRTRPEGRRSTLEIVDEPASGTLLLIGRGDEVDDALALLKARDDAVPATPQMDLEIVEIAHSDAAVIAGAVGRLLADEGRWPEALRAASRAGVAVGQPTVTADAARGRLLISAPSQLMPLARELVRELDQPRSGSVDVRVFTLMQADPAGVADAIRTALSAARPGRPAPTVVAEPSTSSILVTASSDEIREIEEIVSTLDQGYGSDQAQVRTVFLRHARAETVAPIVQELLAGERIPAWTRMDYLRRRLPVPDEGPDVRVAADARLNAVIISAPPAALNVAEQMVVQLDVDPDRDAGLARSVRVLVVENAGASELAANLEALFDEDDAGRLPPTFRVDAASNTLLVRATDAQFDTIDRLVSEIDRATVTTSRQMRVIPIDASRASAEDVARTLERMLDRGREGRVEVITLEELLRRRDGADEQPGPRPGSSSRRTDDPGGSGDPGRSDAAAPAPSDDAHDPTVAGDPGVTAFLDWMASYGRASGAADAPSRVVGSSLEASTVLSVNGPGEDDRADALRSAITADRDVTIAFDPATNSLIVIGPPRAIDRLAEFAGQIQEQLPPEPGRVRYVALPPEADARVLAGVIDRTLRQVTPPGGRAGDLRRRASVVADEANNALVIASTDRDFEMIGELVAALARPASAEQVVVKVYPLETISAERAEASVRQLITPAAPRRGRQAQRMRTLALKLLAGEREIDAVFNPERVTVASDLQTNSLVVMGPADAIGFIDQYVALLDQRPVNVQTTLKLYHLRHAKAAELGATLRSIFRARFQSLHDQPGAARRIEPEFASDARTNVLLITASPEQLAEVDGLLAELDRPTGEDLHPLRTIELAAAQPTRAAELLQQIVVGSDQQRRAATLIIPDDNSGVLLVRASGEVNAEIDAVLAEIDRDAARAFEIRTITLERADAQAVAGAVQRFFDDRAQIASTGRGRREQSRRISIIGDAASKTLLVAASDEDFEQIERLVAQFDTPQATDALSFRVFPLRHAKAAEIEDTVNNLINDLTWGQDPFIFFFGGRGGSNRRQRGTIAVHADARLNALIVTGEGDKFELIAELIDVLDAPPAEGEVRVVRLYPVEHGDPQMVADILGELFADPARAQRWWLPPDPNEVKIRLDAGSRTLIVSGTKREQEEIAEVIASIDTQVTPADHEIAVLSVEFGDSRDIARTLNGFLDDRARGGASPRSTATIVASASANSLVVSAPRDEMATIRDLLARLDEPDVSGDRVVEIIALEDGDAEEIGRIVREQFGRSAGQGVIVTPDIRTNSLIVNAPKLQFARAKALIDQLDTPGASDETIIRTYDLEGARAEEVVRILSSTLQLDTRGETSGITIKLDEDAPAVEVKAKIVADMRSNSLIVTATSESIPVIESLIRRLDEVPAASPVEYRIIPLEHAVADDVALTLNLIDRWPDDAQGRPSFDFNRLENQLIVAATADQFEQIESLLEQIDQPSDRARITDFVPLQFAEAEKIREALSFFYGTFALEADTPGKRNVRIVADAATNSLVISADEAEWADIRALLGKLDSAEYDSSLQLQVIPLTYADATSVAQAINDAFQGTIDRDRRARGARAAARPRTTDGEAERRDQAEPAVLVEAEEWVRASAERQTNSVIVSASRQNLRKIEQIVTELDVADYAQLPAPRLIPVLRGDAVQLADALNRLYVPADGERGRIGLRIVGDEASNTVIVRADDEEFEQIAQLAGALQEHGASGGLSVRVVKLAAAPARRVAEAITTAYDAKAKQLNQPFSIDVDAAGNSLVIAAATGLFEEIEETVRQLDELAPAAGQGIFIIELEHVAPEEVKSIIESIGLDRPPRDDTVSRLVTEPVTISVLAGRRAVVVVASPADRDTLVGIIKAIDAEPALAESQMRIVRLQRADAGAVARILGEVLTPVPQQVQTPLAKAVQEQVRRLAVRRDGLDEGDLKLDLTTPIRVIADESLNAILIASTPANVAAVAELVRTFDQLPLTDAVTVQIFPLQNIAADQFVRIVNDLFTQGKDLAAVPGTDRTAVPGGMIGEALLDEIAISVDARTNTVIVAGREDSVALVEVLTKRLDGEVAVGWLEPRLIRLRFADATDLASLLDEVLVRGGGGGSAEQASPLQSQVGRLRMARMRENGGNVIESELFAPMTRLVIRPEPQLNAIVLIGTPTNIELVSELVAMLDVKAASPDATVRIYPVEHASASRVATILAALFDEQVQSKAIRPEDRVIVEADERTNSLIVTTSPRSFAVLEGLVRALDVEIAPELREVRRLELANASAERLSRLIQQLMDARLERLRQVQPETAELERVTILPDTRSNSLVVVAGNESFDVVKRLATDLDRVTLMDSSLVEVIPLDKSNVDRVAQIINEVMGRRYADVPAELRASEMPLVVTDPRSNSLLVAASEEDLFAIGDLVAKLEAAPLHPAVALHVLTVPPASSAEELAPRLSRVMQERQQSLGPARQPADNVTIEADPRSNTLLVAASDENVEIVRGLIDVLVEAEADKVAGRGYEVIPVQASRATEIVDLVDELYVVEANRRGGEGSVRVTADERVNAVLVSGSTADVAAIRDLIARLDGAEPAAVVQIKYLPLQSANAIETVALIENVLSGRGIGARRGSPQATVLKYLTEIGRQKGWGEDAQMHVSAAIRESIVLTPDVRTNTIIVTAPPQSMDMIERMVMDLDATSTGSKNIRIFKLVNADATAMAEILTDLFNLRQGNDLFVLKPRESGEGAPATLDGGLGDTGFGGTELTAVPDERQQLSITVDSRTNSLLVSGTPTYLDLVAEVVVELDALEANEREVFVYQLRNAEAEEVARVLGEFIDQEQEKLVSTLSADEIGSAARLLEREITIQGDAKSNTVLVSASPRYMERVKEMIKRLDVDPPQVLIQVMLAEVTLDSTDEWGVDMSFDAEIGGSNISGGFGLATAFLPGMGVPNLMVATADFDLMIRALQSQGRVAVLSNPSVMAANNEPARIQVGETIRVAESSSFTDAGTSNTNLTNEELGIILDVTPSINPDGFVRLRVVPKISNLTSRTIQITEDLESPVITIRTAETTVTVHDGQTIIIGGLISDRFEHRERKVPFFGDIPLVGALFRSETDDRKKTELLIVLTPHVIQSPAELGRMNDITEGEIDRLTLPDRIKQRIREGTFDLGDGLFDAQGNPVKIDLHAPPPARDEETEPR